MLPGRLSAALAAAIFMVAAGNAGAATIAVTTTSGSSPAGDGLCSLGEAVADVNAPGASGSDCAPAAFGANTITLGAHTYQLAPPVDGQSALSIASSVTQLRIVGAGESATTIDASETGARALEIASGAGVVLSDLTVTGGHAPDGTAGAPSVDDGTGGNGVAGADGGAILNHGSLAVSDAAVTNSTAGNGGPGGAGGHATSSYPSGPPTAGWGGMGGQGGGGGGIYNTGKLTLQGATLIGNQAGSGGPGGPGGTIPNGDPTYGGAGGGGGAGGAVENDVGTLVVTASTINGNRAGRGGDGGLYGDGSFTGPGWSGGDGGGIDNFQGSLSITNSTLASDDAGDAGHGGNAAPNVGPGPPPAGTGGSGGALAVTMATTATLLNDTIVGNGAGAAGMPDGFEGAAGGVAVGNSGSSPQNPLLLQNTLLYLNSGGNCSGSITDGGHNLSFGAGGCPASFAAGNPNLGPLQDNGGPTKTISLQPGSAAIDAVPAAGAGCPATDQRGVPRPAGKACEIGAYEVAAPKARTQMPSSVSAHGATLTAEVAPNSGEATVTFRFGRTRKYGSQTKAQQVGGVSATFVSAKIGRLKLNTTYHFRVRVASMDGTTVGVDRSFTASNRPVLRSLSLRAARFKVAGAKTTGKETAGAGTTISYTDNLAARTRLSVMMARPGIRQGRRCVVKPRHGASGRACTRYVRVGGFSHTDVIGRNQVPFTGRLGQRELPAGRYELKAAPRAFGRSGKARTARFTVMR